MQCGRSSPLQWGTAVTLLAMLVAYRERQTSLAPAPVVSQTVQRPSGDTRRPDLPRSDRLSRRDAAVPASRGDSAQPCGSCKHAWQTCRDFGWANASATFLRGHLPCLARLRVGERLRWNSGNSDDVPSTLDCQGLRTQHAAYGLKTIGKWSAADCGSSGQCVRSLGLRWCTAPLT
jgi:hypothetical protein